MNMKEKLQSLVQNSIVLDISEELEKYEACSTHFGGQPDVPADFQWPRYQGKGYNYECEERPLTFLSQFNCAEFMSRRWTWTSPSSLGWRSGITAM